MIQWKINQQSHVLFSLNIRTHLCIWITNSSQTPAVEYEGHSFTMLGITVMLFETRFSQKGVASLIPNWFYIQSYSSKLVANQGWKAKSALIFNSELGEERNSYLSQFKLGLPISCSHPHLHFNWMCINMLRDLHV